MQLVDDAGAVANVSLRKHTNTEMHIKVGCMFHTAVQYRSYPAPLRDYLADIARLLPELPDRALLGRLAFVNQAGGELNHDFVDGRPELLLEQQLRACRAFQNSDDLDGIDGALLRPRRALGGFPRAGDTLGVEVGEPSE